MYYVEDGSTEEWDEMTELKIFNLAEALTRNEKTDKVQTKRLSELQEIGHEIQAWSGYINRTFCNKIKDICVWLIVNCCICTKYLTLGDSLFPFK